MERVMILNGSPRAPKSNSKRYAEIFTENCRIQTEYFNITKTNHESLCAKMKDVSNVLFVFPLYADGLPVTLLSFLKFLEENPPETRPVISILVNCGFIEYQQNHTALKMMQLFCSKNGYTFGSALEIGSGEAILSTPFKWLVKRKIKNWQRLLMRKSIEFTA